MAACLTVTVYLIYPHVLFWAFFLNYAHRDQCGDDDDDDGDGGSGGGYCGEVKGSSALLCYRNSVFMSFSNF